MPDAIRQVQPPLEFIPPRFNPWIRRGLSPLLPWILRSRCAIDHVAADNIDQLAELYRQFDTGKIRLLLAFRHPSADDPLCLADLIWHQLPKAARKRQMRLSQPTHSYFMYDRGVPLWTGEWSAWLYSRLGGTSIRRGKLDTVGLRSARDLFVNGQFPLAAAPEGAINGHTEIVSPLEPGLSHLSFWCMEDLKKAGRSEDVVILPIGVKFFYRNPPWMAIAQLLADLEADVGLTAPRQVDAAIERHLYDRMYRLAQHLLALMEQFYSEFFHQPIPVQPFGDQPMPHEVFAERLNQLLDAALKAAEQHFDLPAKGNLIDRCRRLEQAGWDWIFRDDIKDLEALSPVERGLADRVAVEADLRLWHMRLVESFVAVTGKYVFEKPTAERLAETVLLMWDLVTRIKGRSPFGRPNLGRRRAVLTIGQPLTIADRWETYKSGRKQAKQAVADLTQDLQAALESMV